MNNLKLLPIIAFAILWSANANAQKAKLSNDKIPDEITNYINHNFKDHKIRRAAKEVDKDKTEYEIILNKKVELEFDGDYKIKEIESKHGIPSQLLPSRLLEYIKVHYPDFKIIEWELNEDGHKVELSNKTEIRFNANGDYIQ
ncbi:MAG: PepSY-like domain-containing protein [Chitinophagaceae bacterium]|nr:PepSY-like domain-containing protein [Chitinophagaceae bacterium]